MSNEVVPMETTIPSQDDDAPRRASILEIVPPERDETVERCFVLAFLLALGVIFVWCALTYKPKAIGKCDCEIRFE